MGKKLAERAAKIAAEGAAAERAIERATKRATKRAAERAEVAKFPEMPLPVMRAEFPTCPVTATSLTQLIPEETKEEMLGKLSAAFLKQHSLDKKRQLVEDCFHLGIENIKIVEHIMGECAGRWTFIRD